MAYPLEELELLFGEMDEKSQKTVAAQSEIGNLAGLQLKLELVCDQGDEFRIGGFAFRND